MTDQKPSEAFDIDKLREVPRHTVLFHKPNDYLRIEDSQGRVWKTGWIGDEQVKSPADPERITGNPIDQMRDDLEFKKTVQIVRKPTPNAKE